MKKILTNKLFLTVFAADLLSNFGDTVYYLALMNYVLLIPQSNIGISVITLSEGLPYIFGFFVGIYADRTKNKIDTIIATQVVRLVLYALIGIAMGFAPALWIVIVASLINFLSDLSGKYENGLYTPISLRIVRDEDRAVASGFKSSISSVAALLFQYSGAILIAFLSYQHLAFLNAATFGVAAVVMLSIRPALNRLLEERPVKQTESSDEEMQGGLGGLFANAKMVFSEIMNIPELRLSMLIIPVINGIGSLTGTLLLLHIHQNPDMVIVSVPWTLSLISIAFFTGSVIGGLSQTTLAKKIDIITGIRLSVLLLVFEMLAFLSQNVFIVCFILFAQSLVVGMIQPKMNALVMNTLPEDRLATIGAGIDSYFTASIFLMTVITSGLILILSAVQITLLFLIMSVLLLLYTVKHILDEKRTS